MRKTLRWLLLPLVLAFPVVLAAQRPLGDAFLVNPPQDTYNFVPRTELLGGGRAGELRPHLGAAQLPRRRRRRHYGKPGLFLRPFTADGAPLGAAVKAMNAQPVVGFDAAVDASLAAGFATAWDGEEETSIQSRIYVRRFTADGLPLGPLRQANGYSAPEQLEPVVAGPAGSFVVAWTSGPSQLTDILVRRFRR